MTAACDHEVFQVCPVGGLGSRQGLDGGGGEIPDVGGAFAVDEVGPDATLAAADPGVEDLRHALVESGQLLHRLLHLSLGRQRRQVALASVLDRLFPAEVGNFLDPRLVLKTGALLGEAVDGLLVGAVGGQPDLPPQLLVVVPQRKRHGKPLSDHPGTQPPEIRKIGVVEVVVSNPQLHRQASVAAPSAAAEQSTQNGRATPAFGFANPVGHVVGPVHLLQLQPFHGPTHLVPQGLHQQVFLGLQREAGQQNSHPEGANGAAFHGNGPPERSDKVTVTPRAGKGSEVVPRISLSSGPRSAKPAPRERRLTQAPPRTRLRRCR